MSKLSPESLHALLMAMQNEQDTVQIYEHMLRHVTNPQARELLHRLIVEEHNHEQKIKERFFEGGGEMVEESKIIGMDEKFPDRGQIFHVELENCNVSELVNIAIESEQMNRDFYRSQEKRARHNEVKEIFKWLAEQEEIHISNLRNEYGSYLT
ncbi:MAG: hypothetical protein EH225_09210 [Calditrichaeota bacterium]|nr:ferritin family protein [Calditrichota bacterium]RQW01788.1 MAG: hypothetical protein EH225_09210 [Calditrichota bacterium]